jgi:hypothetical protein
MSLKFDLTGKHKLKADLGVTREAERVPPVSRLDFETNHVVVGSKEPDEGRYNTLSRLTYRHGAVGGTGVGAGGAGEETAAVESANQLRRDAKERSLANNRRNFSLPLDVGAGSSAAAAAAGKGANGAAAGGPHQQQQLISEIHQAQQSSRDILDAFNRRAGQRHEVGVFAADSEERRRMQRSPPRLQAMLRQHELAAGNIQQAADMKEHMRRMNATSIVEGASTAGAFGMTLTGASSAGGGTFGGEDNSEVRRERREALQSTHKTSFEQRDSADQVAQRRQAALELRRVQTASSATPIEDVPTRWASEARSNYGERCSGVKPEALCRTAQKQHLRLDDAEGRELQKTGDALRSLYQADLKKPPPEASAATPVISWHRHQISLGSDSRQTAPSLYRASFTPTVFVEKGRSNSPPAAGKK